VIALEGVRTLRIDGETYDLDAEHGPIPRDLDAAPAFRFAEGDQVIRQGSERSGVVFTCLADVPFDVETFEASATSNGMPQGTFTVRDPQTMVLA
jgi:hypothetical protein